MATVHESDLYGERQPAWQHPFDVPRVQTLINDAFPEIVGRVTQAVRPGISERPEDLEVREVSLVQEMMRPGLGEGPFSYLGRTIASETIGTALDYWYTNASNDLSMSTASLVARSYPAGEWDTPIEQLVSWPELDYPTLREAITALQESGDEQRTRTLATAVDCFLSNYRGSRFRGNQAERILYAENHQRSYDTVGYRLVRLFHAVPQMLTPVQDHELLAEFNCLQEMCGAQLLSIARRNLLRFFSTPNRPEAELSEAIRKILLLRTHPDIQIFFQYMSSLGYISSPKDQEA